jgi:hypothetical protein
MELVAVTKAGVEKTVQFTLENAIPLVMDVLVPMLINVNSALRTLDSTPIISVNVMLNGKVLSVINTLVHAIQNVAWVPDATVNAVMTVCSVTIILSVMNTTIVIVVMDGPEMIVEPTLVLVQRLALPAQVQNVKTVQRVSPTPNAIAMTSASVKKTTTV